MNELIILSKRTKNRQIRITSDTNHLCVSNIYKDTIMYDFKFPNLVGIAINQLIDNYRKFKTHEFWMNYPFIDSIPYINELDAIHVNPTSFDINRFEGKIENQIVDIGKFFQNNFEMNYPDNLILKGNYDGPDLQFGDRLYTNLKEGCHKLEIPYIFRQQGYNLIQMMFLKEADIKLLSLTN